MVPLNSCPFNASTLTFTDLPNASSVIWASPTTAFASRVEVSATVKIAIPALEKAPACTCRRITTPESGDNILALSSRALSRRKFPRAACSPPIARSRCVRALSRVWAETAFCWYKAFIRWKFSSFCSSVACACKTCPSACITCAASSFISRRARTMPAVTRSPSSTNNLSMRPSAFVETSVLQTASRLAEKVNTGDRSRRPTAAASTVTVRPARARAARSLPVEMFA